MEYINEQINETGAVNAEGYISGLSALENITKEQEKTGSKITRFFKSQYRKVLAFGLALVTVFTLAGCKDNAKENTETTSITAEMLDEDHRHVIPETELFNVLLNKSDSEVQRDVLLSVGNFLADYNIRFADPIEDDVTLYDKEGNVIGINTIKITSAEGIGFAIPINIVRPIIEKYEQLGEFKESYLGIFAYDGSVMSYVDKNINLSKGVYIEKIVENSPASQTELKKGDIITRIDNTSVNKMSELQEYIFNKNPKDEIILTIVRNNKERQIKVILGER